MVRVIGIDPGTVSIDLCGLADGQLWLDQSWPTVDAVAEPERLVAALIAAGPIDLITGPSGYGLPLVPARQLTEDLLRLAFLSEHGDAGGIGGLKRLVRLLAGTGLPMVLTPGVIHLPTVPSHRKVNRVDLGTADKLATAALAIFDQARRIGGSAVDTSFILLELGGAFTAAVAVDRGRIVDGQGGSSGPMGWRSSGAWDGEVAFLAERVTKDLLFKGGADGQLGGWAATAVVDLEGYCESAVKAVLALTASLSSPREILLAGRQATRPEVRATLVPKLRAIAPVRDLEGFAGNAKHAAQGAALIADGLAGGAHTSLVETLRIREASGTALDHLRVISPADARRRIGLR